MQTPTTRYYLETGDYIDVPLKGQDLIDYNNRLAADQAQATAEAAAQVIVDAGDPATGLANLIAVLLKKGVIDASDLPDAQITAVTDKLTQLGDSEISVGVATLPSVEAAGAVSEVAIKAG